MRNVGLRWSILVSYEACWSPMRNVGLWWSMLVSDWFPIRHVGLWWGMLVSDGSRMRMLVSDGSPRRHVGLWWVSDEACWSPMRYVSLQWVSDRSPIIIIFLWTWFSQQTLYILLPTSTYALFTYIWCIISIIIHSNLNCKSWYIRKIVARVLYTQVLTLLNRTVQTMHC